MLCIGYFLFPWPGSGKPGRSWEIKNAPLGGAVREFAERMGFEPMIRFWRIHTFQACAFDHSAISPGIGFNRKNNGLPCCNGALNYYFFPNHSQ
jgi:hypothetical protein